MSAGCGGFGGGGFCFRDVDCSRDRDGNVLVLDPERATRAREDAKEAIGKACASSVRNQAADSLDRCLARLQIAYYLGDLESSTPSSSSAPGTAQPRTIFRVMGSLDDPFEAFARDDPCEAFARALQYSSADDLENALIKKEFVNRHTAACRRLFKKVGLDYETTRLSVLFDAFTAMVNRLPDQWLNWVRSILQQYCANLEIAPGSNLPRRLSDENFLLYPRVRFSLTGRRRAGGAQPNSNRHDRTLRKSRVFTQISNPAGRR